MTKNAKKKVRGSIVPLSAARPSQVSGAARAYAGERLVRLSIDIPEALRRRIKSTVGGDGGTVQARIQALLEREFPAVAR